jgi:hypothetical protein
LPNIRTIRVGNIYLKTDGRNGRHGGQLAQDIIMLVADAPNIDELTITYHTVDDAPVTMKILDFLDTMQRASGKTKQIIIDDDSYTNLLSLSALNIQAKAGFNQAP